MEYLDKHPYIIEALFLALFIVSEVLASLKKVKANSVVQLLKGLVVTVFAKRNPQLAALADALEPKPAPPSDPDAK